MPKAILKIQDIPENAVKVSEDEIILGEENLDKKIFRVQLSKKVADIIKSSFKLLGIEVPERM